MFIINKLLILKVSELIKAALELRDKPDEVKTS